MARPCSSRRSSQDPSPALPFPHRQNVVHLVVPEQFHQPLRQRGRVPGSRRVEVVVEGTADLQTADAVDLDHPVAELVVGAGGPGVENPHWSYPSARHRAMKSFMIAAKRPFTSSPSRFMLTRNSSIGTTLGMRPFPIEPEGGPDGRRQPSVSPGECG